MIMKNTILILILFLSIYGCRNSYELSMERGEYFYNAGAYEEATLEYKSVINHYPSDIKVLDEKTTHMLDECTRKETHVYLVEHCQKSLASNMASSNGVRSSITRPTTSSFSLGMIAG